VHRSRALHETISMNINVLVYFYRLSQPHVRPTTRKSTCIVNTMYLGTYMHVCVLEVNRQSRDMLSSYQLVRQFIPTYRGTPRVAGPFVSTFEHRGNRSKTNSYKTQSRPCHIVIHRDLTVAFKASTRKMTTFDIKVVSDTVCPLVIHNSI
jgi:hypothetical protein